MSAPTSVPWPYLQSFPLRSGIAWGLVFVFALMGAAFYGLNAWLPNAYVEHGWRQSSAGALLGLLNIASLPGALLVPFFARPGRRASALPDRVLGPASWPGLLGLVLAPGADWLFAVVAGLGVGGLFPLVLTLPLNVAEKSADVGALIGLMLGAGYCLSALSPLVLGALRDLSRGFSAVLWTVVALSVLLLTACLPFSAERLNRRPQEPNAVWGA